MRFETARDFASTNVTVVIPTLPERVEQLARAVDSVNRQTCPPAAVIVETDRHRRGAAATRNAALARVRTEWVAFLDDDDLFHPDHLETLIAGAHESGADLISTYPQPDRPLEDSLSCCYQGELHCPPLNIPWGPEQIDHFDTRKGPKCSHCGHPRDSFIMFTNLVRMDMIRRIGGIPQPGSMGKHFRGWAAEDYLFLLALLDAGAKFHHVPGVRTWTYHVKQPDVPTTPVAIAREAIDRYGALQKGNELASFLALLMDVEPKVIVEIGCADGGTLWAWQQLPSKPRVIGVSLSGGEFDAAVPVGFNDHGAEFLYGDSHDLSTLGKLRYALAGKPVDVLFIDGDHTFEGVKQDFKMYKVLVRPGGIIAFHDICDHPTMPSVKVKAFWDTLEWDGDREEIITDQAPGAAPWGGIGILRVPVAAEVAA